MNIIIECKMKNLMEERYIECLKLLPASYLKSSIIIIIHNTESAKKNK